MPSLWNRSSSLASSGGLTTRSGSNTEQIYNFQSAPTQQTSSSSSPGFWGGIKNFFSNHAEGTGKVIGAGLNIGAKIADKYASGLASPIVNAAKEGIAMIGDEFKGSGFHKFTSGLANKKIDNITDKAGNVFDNNNLDKVGKWKEVGSIISNYRTENNKAKPLSLIKPVSNSSNGHVPVGYPALSSSEGSGINSEFKSIVPTGSTSILLDKPNNKNKNNKNKNKSNKTAQSNNRRKNKNKNKNKGRKRK